MTRASRFKVAVQQSHERSTCDFYHNNSIVGCAMSTVYNLEPPTTAKVILTTTAGDLTLELFAKQTPLASRNFLQHCLDGYYNGTIFHRLVPGFIIQGGDPTGTGAGGISAISEGDGFGDEVHSRLKFNRRGLLGMAKGEDGKNGRPEVQGLQGVCTMFGRIEGETIYNLMKMAEAEMSEGENSERPLYPAKITGTEVLVNPFEDMVARVREAPRMAREDGKREAVKKRKKPAGKNVLSFGGEDGEEDAAAPVLKKVKANPKMVAVGSKEPERLEDTMTTGTTIHRSKPRQEREQSPVNHVSEPKAAALLPVQKELANETDESDDEESELRAKNSALDRTNAEFAALKASMKRTVAAAPTEKDRPRNALEAMIPTTSTRGRKRGKVADEKGAMDIFRAFKTRLGEMPAAKGNGDRQVDIDESPIDVANIHLPAAENVGIEADEDEANLCDLHFIPNCQSCRSWDHQAEADVVDADADDGSEWMSHTLSFAKDLLGKDLKFKKSMAEIEVIDPRAKANEIKQEIAGKRRGKGKGKGKG
ncbi:Peptidyl-prolyl isomerase cwc27 [Friedmanniomyces endolithicus]|nr:Peptidyl-prolyl isomerase cwc27 [Friedmanniomyces endolithicus]KAK1005476.1 Peptidyl-prolyl isomerase cwc27 [Friedmanniomyces endolithicus]KAK1048674.1 Peptidyl-prolyl isomerase cwc27 [Friedmanniomyces endolithicus]